ncbi:patatin-like phospholipase family protein [Actinoallomurus rhizosphaericola]|uniref:patatin-like phospholipase family protein n=1 Tax=Actinoallomurus rhizosphaericola TaxID=2952536 RepID=UPI002090EA5E|nr:patatin-like phospholipase family protein [Actinoallomurus rhizosphaericola]MCO5992039.1 patatin-like phospholipase family protein [Actinoallomurus rhizosphaericola]
MNDPKTAFVLGGGGLLGAHEVGMLRALAEAGIRPDLIVGTSVGAFNGAFVASDPEKAADLLTQAWQGEGAGSVFAGSFFSRVSTLIRSGTHLHSTELLATALDALIPADRIEDLAVPFHCVAANIERAEARWFTRGPLVPAVLASCAVPGVLPPVRIGDEHFYDGGLVHSIPIGRALREGARTVYVLQVGRIEKPLTAPTRPWQVGLVAFEIARRHRFAEEMGELPDDVTVHVLPTGSNGQSVGLSQLRYRDASRVETNIERAYEASRAYLSELPDSSDR